MRAAWSSPTTSIHASSADHLDPGTGLDRYRIALDQLRSSGRPMAMAAFTFDPDEAGSLVLAPTYPAQPSAGDPLPRGQVTDDGRRQWEEGFDLAAAALGSGEVEKVVLARRVECTFDSAVDPAEVWRALVDANPGTYSFLVDGFVGASPELLVRVDGDRVESLALAGTAPSQEGLSGDLITSEHRHAADSVADVLARYATDVSAHRGTHRFGDLSHVGTRFEGRLKRGVTVLDVLAALHPTAAVGGTPTETAIRVIRRIESPRGLYSGPVGWFDADGNGEFAIALRCGLISGSRATLYAGGGLLAGSDRDREWKETDLKLRPMLRALGLEG